MYDPVQSSPLPHQRMSIIVTKHMISQNPTMHTVAFRNQTPLASSILKSADDDDFPNSIELSVLQFVDDLLRRWPSGQVLCQPVDVESVLSPVRCSCHFVDAFRFGEFASASGEKTTP
jgi:hypothetical protein